MYRNKKGLNLSNPAPVKNIKLKIIAVVSRNQSQEVSCL